MNNILTNIRKEHDRKHGADIKDEVYNEAEVECIDKFLNKIKVVKINRSPIFFNYLILKKREIASKNRFVVNRAIKVFLIMEKDIKKFC